MEGFDHRERARRVFGILDPHLRQRGVDRKLAREAGGVRVEDARANASMGKEIDEEMGLGEIGRGVDPFQNFTETMPVTPSSLIPERPETLKYARLTATLLVIHPFTPTLAVVNVLSLAYAGRS